MPMMTPHTCKPDFAHVMAVYDVRRPFWTRHFRHPVSLPRGASVIRTSHQQEICVWYACKRQHVVREDPKKQCHHKEDDGICGALVAFTMPVLGSDVLDWLWRRRILCGCLSDCQAGDWQRTQEQECASSHLSV